MNLYKNIGYKTYSLVYINIFIVYTGYLDIITSSQQKQADAVDPHSLDTSAETSTTLFFYFNSPFLLLLISTLQTS